MSLFYKILKSEQGLSLVEVTIAAAISIVISFAVMKSNETGQKGLTKITTDLDLKLWQQQVLLNQFSDNDACINTFGSVSPDVEDLSQVSLKNSANEAFVNVNEVIPNTQNAWTLKSIKRAAFMSTSGSSGLRGICELRLTVERNKNSKSSFGAKIKDIVIPLLCVKRNDNSWASCSGQSGSTNLWAEYLSPSSDDYIHSNGKYVRVGTGGFNASAPFHVADVSTSDFPEEGTGVKEAIRVDQRNAALVLGRFTALFEDNGGCSILANGFRGSFQNGYKHCVNGSANFVNIGGDNTRVGINKANPRAPLDIDSIPFSYTRSIILNDSRPVGTINASNSIAYSAENSFRYTMFYEHEFDSWGVYYVPFTRYSLVVNKDKVGIGVRQPSERLEVGGAIKIANTTTSCTSDSEGVMKYNSSNKGMEYCNGSEWVSVGKRKERINATFGIFSASPFVKDNITCTQFTISSAPSVIAKRCECPSGYVVVTGGGSCSDPNNSRLITSNPFISGPSQGWSAACSSSNLSLSIICERD